MAPKKNPKNGDGDRASGWLRDSVRTALTGVSIGELADALPALDQAMHLIPPRSRQQLLAVARQVLDTADRMGVTDAWELLGKADDVLKRHTSVDNLTAYLRSDTAEPLHLARNMLTAALAAATFYNGGKVPGVAEYIATLKTRSALPNRPLADDEIVLLRLDALAALAGDPKSIRSAGVYILCETGVTPRETTTVSPSSFDEPDAPTSVLTAGTPGFCTMRLLAFDPFQQKVMRKVCEARAGRHHEHQPLTYTGKKPGTAAAVASAQPIIDRALKRWGLNGVDVTAYSLCLWAASVAYDRDGIHSAVAVTGKANERTMSLLNLAPPTIKKSKKQRRKFSDPE